MKKVQRVDYLFQALRVAVGVTIAFLICLVIIALLTGRGGAQDAIYNFAIGPLTSKRRFAQVLSRMGVYMLTGCGMCFVYASGRFSVISEGIINLAPIPILTVMFGTGLMTNLPRSLNLAIMLAACMVTGMAISMIPAYGRERLGADETVTSIILNSFCCFIALSILRGTVADRTASFLASPVYPENMHYTRYLNGSNLHSGIWIAILGYAGACVIFYRTKLGSEIRIAGSNPAFAKYAGINIQVTMFMGQILAGILAGMAACIEVFGTYGQYYLSQLTNLGMDGLVVAVMAKKQPLFVPVTAFVLAYIRTSASVLNTNTNIPIELVTMLQAVIIFFVAAESFLGKIRQRAIIKVSQESEAKG